MQPLSTAAEVMDKVMADLTEAAGLLANDPVITNGIIYNNDFYAAAATSG